MHPTRYKTEPMAAPDEVTALVLNIFRVNGRLLLAGDRLVGPVGLTSARWQILGGIAAAQTPQPVVRLARDIGVSRQAVQRIANELAREGLVAFEPNPNHKRAHLMVFTSLGRARYEEALALQRPWAAALAEGLTSAQAEAACGALESLERSLDKGG